MIMLNDEKTPKYSGKRLVELMESLFLSRLKLWIVMERYKFKRRAQRKQQAERMPFRR